MDATNNLFIAAKDGNTQDIARLIKSGQNPNTGGCSGYTALHVACAFGHAETVKEILKNGGNPEQETDDGKTALAIAEGKGYNSVVEIIKGGDWKVNTDT